jgi:hypothetical protein
MTTPAAAARAARDLAEWRDRVNDAMATLDNIEWDLADARATSARADLRKHVDSALGWARALVKELEELEERIR